MIYSTPGTNDKIRTPPPQKKKNEYFSSQSKNKSDIPSNKVVMEEKKLLPRMYRTVFLRFRNLFQNLMVLLLLRII